ncbi:hypothetical protein BC936DRAFT_141071 [Jimgerdemannia flammicorona]|nr:hypothetical protein BC936DRAFT_141071 [Jimgerdemannia flammicorona]
MSMFVDVINFANKKLGAGRTGYNPHCHLLVADPHALSAEALQPRQSHQSHVNDDAVNSMLADAQRTLIYWCDWVVTIDVGVDEGMEAGHTIHTFVARPSQLHCPNVRRLGTDAISGLVTVRYHYDGDDDTARPAGRPVVLDLTLDGAEGEIT